MERFAILILLFTITACSSTYLLTIEVQEPASITLPVNINRILIVNNTVPQPPNMGINRIHNGKLVKNYELDIDSVSWITMDAFISNIKEAQFFNEISLYTKLVREDNEWITTIPLSEEFKNEIFENQGFEAIVSIDKILFNLEEETKNNMLEPLGRYSSVFVDNKLEGRLSCSIFLDSREFPLSSFTLSDSLIYRTSLYSDSLEIFKELPEALINDLAYVLGEKMASYIVPSWSVQERIIYTGNDSRMKEAFSYSKNGKWDRAEVLWLDLLGKKSKNKDIACIANNIAIAEEMQDKLDASLRWAEKAKTYFPEDSEEWAWSNKYIADLRKRIQNSRLLDVQWGKE
jgi:hypothetical protein